MAFLLTRNDILIVISGNEARIFSSSSASSSLCLVARISCEVSTVGSDEVGTENQSEEAAESSLIPGQILSAALSHSGDHLAISDDYKTLKVWDLSDLPKNGPLLVCETILSRRSTALTFSPDDDSVLVADKNGDAYELQIPQQPSKEISKPQRLLGHLGMLLDIRVTSCGKYVITCDRDEKIRVSHFPNAYNIHNFHLAHTQFVYRVCIPSEMPGHFISGGGDGSVIFWSLEHSRPLLVCNGNEDARTQSSPENGDKTKFPSGLQVKCLEYSHPHICVAFNEAKIILVYRISFSSKPEVSLVQTLQFPSVVWDCKFTNDGNLYVLTTEKSHLKHFKVSESVSNDADVEPFLEADTPNLIFDGNDSITALEASLVSALKTPNLFAILTKSKIDNMKTYLETKEKRLAEGNARWGKKKGGSPEDTAEAKKTKA